MAITQVSSLSSVQSIFDKYAYFALRKALYYDAVASVKPSDSNAKGSGVVFVKWTDMATATSAISQTSDITATTMADGTVTVTNVEYGAGIETTAKLRDTSYLEVDRDAANIVGYNAGESMDEIARDVLIGGTNVIYPGTVVSRATVGPTSVATQNKLREMRAKLKSGKAMTFADGFYRGFIDSKVLYDIKVETGEAAWSYPHAHSAPENVLNGDMGVFDGIRWIETPEVKTYTNTGGSVQTVEVLVTLVVGDQALAKAYVPAVGPYAKIIHGPVVDRLERFEPISWYWHGGYGRFREESIYRLESSSSLNSHL